MTGLLVAQITDLHIKPIGELAYRQVDTAAALAHCVAHLNGLRPRPDIVVVTGDLVDGGKPEEYAHLKRLLAELALPLVAIPGNHDAREAMRLAFPNQPYASRTGAMNIHVPLGPLDLLLLDSSVAGKDHGALDADTLAWLDATLSASPERPALLFVHHPPFATGIAHMDKMYLTNGTDLAPILNRHVRARMLATGHVHRAVHTRFADLPASICPAPNFSVALDLSPDKIPSLVIEPPGFHLHAWLEGGRFGNVVTHLVPIGEFRSRPFHAL
jgi:3',5'-cyclic AMP phosphodiesterase CpdA